MRFGTVINYSVNCTVPYRTVLGRFTRKRRTGAVRYGTVRYGTLGNGSVNTVLVSGRMRVPKTNGRRKVGIIKRNF